MIAHSESLRRKSWTIKKSVFTQFGACSHLSGESTLLVRPLVSAIRTSRSGGHIFQNALRIFEFAILRDWNCVSLIFRWSQKQVWLYFNFSSVDHSGFQVHSSSEQYMDYFEHSTWATMNTKKENTKFKTTVGVGNYDIHCIPVQFRGVLHDIKEGLGMFQNSSLQLMHDCSLAIYTMTI